MNLLKKIGIASIIILIGIILFYLLFPAEDQRIQNLIQKGKTGIEQEDILKTMSAVSIEYRDQYGRIYASMRSAFLEVFKEVDSITIRYNITDLQIKDDTAYATITVWAYGIINTMQQDIVGDSRIPGQIRLTIRKKDFMWKVVDSEWDDVKQVRSDIFRFSSF